MLKTSRDTATLSFLNVNVYHLCSLTVKEHLIRFETGRNFHGHVSVFTLLVTSISVTIHFVWLFLF